MTINLSQCPNADACVRETTTPNLYQPMSTWRGSLRWLPEVRNNPDKGRMPTEQQTPPSGRTEALESRSETYRQRLRGSVSFQVSYDSLKEIPKLVRFRRSKTS